MMVWNDPRKIIKVKPDFSGMEWFEFSRIWRDSNAQYRRSSIQRRRAQQVVHAAGVHTVSRRTYDREVSNQIR